MNGTPQDGTPCSTGNELEDRLEKCETRLLRLEILLEELTTKKILPKRSFRWSRIVSAYRITGCYPCKTWPEFRAAVTYDRATKQWKWSVRWNGKRVGAGVYSSPHKCREYCTKTLNQALDKEAAQY